MAAALARCHIFKDVQSGVVHVVVVILIVELLMGGQRPYSLRGLPDVHP